jgi:pyruvate dehydrogenase phosphatase
MMLSCRRVANIRSSGWATSTILKGALIPYVSTSLAELPSSSGNDDIDDAIKKAFVALDDRIMDTAVAVVKAHNPGSPEAVAAIAPATAGSCALLAIYDPLTSVLRTAVTGDSRAVLGSWSSQPGKYVASALSLDQTGFNEVEVERIAAEHPGEKQDVLDPKSGRLLGMAVTRAFGDHRWKWPLDFLVHLQANFFDVGPRPKYKTPPYMTARPEITTRKIETEDFVILASDGLWDHMSNDTAVECVSRWLAAKRAGEAETVKEGRPLPPAGRSGWMTWPVTTDDFAIEDLDSAAVCLVKNAFGGNRRELFRGVMTAATPASRYARDDITVQVIFFKDPYSN